MTIDYNSLRRCGSLDLPQRGRMPLTLLWKRKGTTFVVDTVVRTDFSLVVWFLFCEIF